MSPVIVDFGLATKCKQGNYIYNHCGTPGYVAPEILSAKVKTITPNVDIFSLGIVFYMMLFRKFPYSSKELNDILKQNKAASFDLFSLK